MRRSHADLRGDRAVQVERRARGVAQVDDLVVRSRQLGDEVSDSRRLTDARLAGEHAECPIVDGLLERPS
jgi:hypothetical protein